MNDINFKEKLRNTCQKIGEIGSKYAEARALSYLLQEQRKCVLSAEMEKLANGSMADKEMRARCSKVYYEHLVATSKAIRQELSYRAELDKWSAVFEALRSLIGLEKRKIDIL